MPTCVRTGQGRHQIGDGIERDGRDDLRAVTRVTGRDAATPLADVVKARLPLLELLDGRLVIHGASGHDPSARPDVGLTRDALRERQPVDVEVRKVERLAQEKALRDAAQSVLRHTARALEALLANRRALRSHTRLPDTVCADHVPRRLRWRMLRSRDARRRDTSARLQDQSEDASAPPVNLRLALARGQVSASQGMYPTRTPSRNTTRRRARGETPRAYRAHGSARVIDRAASTVN